MTETGFYTVGDVTQAFQKAAKTNKKVYETGRIKIECFSTFADVTMGGIISFRGETREQSDQVKNWKLYFDGKLHYQKLISPASVHGMVSGIGIGIGIIPPIEESGKLNPNELFIMSQIMRSQIADDLNEHLGRKEFSDDDIRLTREVCMEYADDLGEINGVGDDAEDDVVELRSTILKKHFPALEQ